LAKTVSACCVCGGGGVDAGAVGSISAGHAGAVDSICVDADSRVVDAGAVDSICVDADSRLVDAGAVDSRCVACLI
jgi:hypothetical protein